jgi:hypothetical protein
MSKKLSAAEQEQAIIRLRELVENLEALSRATIETDRAEGRGVGVNLPDVDGNRRVILASVILAAASNVCARVAETYIGPGGNYDA